MPTPTDETRVVRISSALAAEAKRLIAEEHPKWSLGRPADIRRWQDSALEGGYSNNTTNTWFRVLKRMFEDVADDYEIRSSCRKIRPLEATRR